MSNAPDIDPNRDERIAIIDLADELLIRKQTIFKVVKRLGLQPRERRESTRGNQLVATVTLTEATAIRDSLHRPGALSPDHADIRSDLPPVFITDDVGVFYLVQLEPDHDSGRFKVGFTTELEGRLRKHRCSAPFVRTVKIWPCRRTWERAAIDCVTAGCDRLHSEVFRAATLDEIAARADKFFTLMPTLPPNSHEAT